MIKRLITLFFAVAVATSTWAQQSALEEITQNRFLSASNYLDYDNYPATAAAMVHAGFLAKTTI